MSVGAGEAKLAQSLLSELGDKKIIHLITDSSSARAITQRRGPGKLRHIVLRELWLQEEVRSGAITVGAVPTQENIADVLTKFVTPVSKFATAVLRLGVRPLEQ